MLTIYPISEVAKVKKISFSSEFNPFELDGSKVTLVGYISTMYPSRGDWIYLVDMPYRNSPYYISESTRFNGILVKLEQGGWIPYTELLVKVDGMVKVEEGIDEMGNPYYFEIVNATCEILEESLLSDAHKAYYYLVSTGILTNLREYLEKTLAAFRYGSPQSLVTTQELDSLIAQIKSIDTTAFSELITVINELKKLNRQIINKDLNEEDQELAIFEAYTQYMEWLARFKI